MIDHKTLITKVSWWGLSSLALLGAVLTVAARPSQTGVTAPAGDDLSQALANHGMSSGDSLLAASAIEFLIANNKALLDRIAADEANWKGAQAQITSLSQTLAILSPPGGDQIQAEYPLASNAVITTASTGDAGGGLKLMAGAAGQWYDYAVNLPAGTYRITARMADGTTAASIHFEYPVGTNVSGALSLPANSTTWTSVVSTQTFTLPGGVQKIRLVADSGIAGQTLVNWFQLTNQ